MTQKMARESTEMENRGGGGGSGMSELTEGCVANIISFTSPRDACRFSVLSSLYRSAADSDIVWDRFLPPDFESLIAQSPQSSSTSTKKQLYFSSFLIENGRKSVWLDKLSGKKCYMLSARDLMLSTRDVRILEGDNPRHWRWTSDSTSRFEEVAELLPVLQLEINGKLDAGMLSPSTLYASYFVFKYASNMRGLDRGATKFAVGFVGRESSERIAYFPILVKQNEFLPFFNPHIDPSVPAKHLAASSRRDVQKRVDGWLEIELGEFFREESEFGELEMHVKRWIGHPQRGLIVGGIEIRPTHNREVV